MLESIAGLVIVGVSVIVAKFVEGVGPRLARRWLPLRSEQAEMENVKLRREELEAQERRFVAQQQHERELKLLEIEKTREMHREDTERRSRYKRWPLQILPVDFLQASAARNGRALNVLFNVVEHRDRSFLKSHDSGAEINRMLDLLNSGPIHAMRQAAAHFQGDVILYDETLKTAHYTGDTLRSTLWSLLQTEPTVLIELNIPKPNELKLYVSHWGGAFEPKAPWVSDYPQTIELREASADTEAALSVGLSGLIVALGDTFRILHWPYEVQSPVFPDFLRNAARPSLSTSVFQPMFNAYASAYDGVAKHSPLLASEMAAHAAIMAHGSHQKEFAEMLLDKSLHLHPALRGDREQVPARLAMFLRHRGRGQGPSEIGKALEMIRELPSDIDGPRSAYGDESFEEFMKRFKLEKKEGS